jgi:hypothetical protein
VKKIVLLAGLLWLSLPAFAWQQRVAYNIDVKLDTASHLLNATEHLSYWNHSPDTLRFIWFHLYPNAFRDERTHYAREAEGFHNYRLRLSRPQERGYMEVAAIRAGDLPLSLVFGSDPTTAKVDLPRPLAPGDSAEFTIKFTVKIPKFIDRLGHRGTHYEISQWYPKPAVYDRKGWHPLGYHYLGEFYGEFGDFQVGLWLPKNLVVGATGVEVKDEADSTAAGDSLDYRLFAARNVHDFAWCADPDYLDTVEVHDGVAIRVLTMRRDVKKWKNVLQYAKDALDYYGRWYGRYPYSTLTVCGGYMAAGGGMEYPNLVIISSGEDRLTRSLEMTVMHEIGHQWFYGMLANNEMDQPWMDEGFNSFSEERYFEEKYGPKANYLAHPRLQRSLPELTDRYTGYFLYHMFAANRMEQPIATRAFQVREPGLYAVTAYKKPAMLLWWLRDYIGNEKFDRLMKEYFRRFCFRHVYWEDFLELADSLTGRPISKLLDPWINTAARCDNGIAAVRRMEEGKDLYAINLVRRDSLSLPSKLVVTDSEGNEQAITWNGLDRSMWFMVRSSSPIERAVLDPERNVPDIDRFNNRWPRKYSLTLGPRLPSSEKYQAFFLPIPWYDGVNGFRLGPFLHGGYMMDGGPMVGRHQWTLFPYYGFKSRQLSFSAGYQTPVSALSMPPRLYLSAGKASDIHSASVGLMRSWGRALFSPTESFDLHLDYSRIVDTSRFLDWRDAEPGSNVILTLSRGSVLSAYRAGVASRVAASGGFLLGSSRTDNSFSRFTLESKAYVRIWRRQMVNLRGFFGSMAGSAPAQEQLFLSGAYKTSGINAVIVSGRDWFSAQEHYHVEGSADVSGYLGRHLRGRLAASANLSLPIYKYPMAVFADGALLTDSYQQLAIKNAYCDAGLSLQAGPVKFLFPLWINRPLEGEKRFDFRWKMGLGGSFSLGI